MDIQIVGHSRLLFCYFYKMRFVGYGSCKLINNKELGKSNKNLLQLIFR